jgi:hypothetical protein
MSYKQNLYCSIPGEKSPFVVSVLLNRSVPLCRRREKRERLSCEKLVSFILKENAVQASGSARGFAIQEVPGDLLAKYPGSVFSFPHHHHESGSGGFFSEFCQREQ